ncbi:hypothetical protein VPH35_066532 [Triticum aestivum]
MSLVGLGLVCRAGGVAALAAFVGGCAKLRAVCRSMEVRGATAVMVDSEAAHGESTTSTAGMKVAPVPSRWAASAWWQRTASRLRWWHMASTSSDAATMARAQRAHGTSQRARRHAEASSEDDHGGVAARRGARWRQTEAFTTTVDDEPCQD